MDISKEFLGASRAYLAEEYLPKIKRCLEMVTDDDVWWRPNEHSNSIGNLVLHLAGNVRQYIVSGVGERPDIRLRDEEFSAQGGLSTEKLASLLEDTVGEVESTLRTLDSGRLSELRTIQGREMTVFEAIYHAIEHFAMHTGQIIQLTKQLTDRDMQFYTFEDGSVQHRW